MYKVIYDEMLNAGAAISLQIPIFTDIDGNPVDETKPFGQKQSIKITKPGWILFADESGFATSQKKDGHVGGQQFVVEKGTVPQTIASTTDHNLPCFHSLQHRVRQYAVQLFSKANTLRFLPLGGLELIFASHQF